MSEPLKLYYWGPKESPDGVLWMIVYVASVEDARRLLKSEGMYDDELSKEPRCITTEKAWVIYV